MTTIYDSLTDTQSKTRALHEVVQLYETVEYDALYICWYTGTRILTIHVESVLAFSLLLFVTYLNMALVCVLDGVGYEVGYNLLNTPTVKRGKIRVVRILLDEFYAWCLNTAL